MTDEAPHKPGEKSEPTSGTEGGDPTSGHINDPLTRRDDEAPRAPFDAKPDDTKE